jgi:hypothetical protein
MKAKPVSAKKLLRDLGEKPKGPPQDRRTARLMKARAKVIKALKGA